MSKILRNIFTGIIVGLISGVLSSLFLHSLNFVTAIRLSHPALVWFLPCFAVLFTYLRNKLPSELGGGVPSLLKSSRVSPWMTPFIFLSSLGTHLFGGSAGREGVGLIMGGSAAQLLTNRGVSYKTLLFSGMAGGFAGIFGTPLTAIIFIIEILKFKTEDTKVLLLNVSTSSLVAFLVSCYIGPKHFSYPVSVVLNYEIIYYVAVCIGTTYVGALFFFHGLKLVTNFKMNSLIKAFVGSFILILIAFFFNGSEYLGIGTDLISRAFSTDVALEVFFYKCLFTILTLGIGLKGGEVTPLFVMGSSFTNSICSLIGLGNYPLSASLGMVSLFGAVTHTPFAAGVMGYELFGPEVGICSFLICYCVKSLLRVRSIYNLD